MCRRWRSGLVAAVMLAPSMALPQQHCTNGMRVEGTITDPTAAVIPGAQVQSASGERTEADPSGHYVLPCITSTPVRITAQFPGFASATSVTSGPRGSTVRLDLKLPIETVRTDVQVNGNETVTKLFSVKICRFSVPERVCLQIVGS